MDLHPGVPPWRPGSPYTWPPGHPGPDAGQTDSELSVSGLAQIIWDPWEVLWVSHSFPLNTSLEKHPFLWWKSSAIVPGFLDFRVCRSWWHGTVGPSWWRAWNGLLGAEMGWDEGGGGGMVQNTFFFGPNSTTQIVEPWGLFQKFEQLKVIQKLGYPLVI